MLTVLILEGNCLEEKTSAAALAAQKRHRHRRVQNNDVVFFK